MTERHIQYLDGWRGLAIVFLLIGHFFPVPGINFGAVGVSLFFVLSGYLMCGLLFVKNTPIPDFYRRRIARIVPAHLFFLGCVILVYLARGIPIEWGETAAALAFVNNYFATTPSMPFGHIWSLSVEEHSYILLSIVALLTRRFNASARWTTAVIAVLCAVAGFWYWTAFTGSELEFNKWIRTEVSAYGIFASCAILLFFCRTKIPALPPPVCPLLLLAGIALHWWSLPMPVRTVLGVGLFALAINLMPAAPVSVKRLLEFKPLTKMGTWSFSIYLWQQPFYLAAGTHDLLPGYVAAPIAVCCGIAAFYLVERPARALLNRVWGRREVDLGGRAGGALL
jgi:peptidoglycan/LPS O-acetylase OafA/YrhL